MINHSKIVYKGINRELYPDWLGWIILDLLADNPYVPKEHRDEIQIQLDYEVRLFRYENIHPKRH